nr:uncharacterized protein LOC117230073 isoform X1 [Megalopta genalis]XP_033343059.1 uncharacterized protein LOC117230073 isoform X1 [Megalopta genalis]
MMQLWNEKKYNNFIQCVPPYLTMFAATAKYVNVMVKIDKVRDLLTFIKIDSERWANQPEDKIYRALSMKGRLYVQILVAYVGSATSVYFVFPVYTLITETRNQKIGNSSEPRSLLYQADYHVDQETYFFWITLHAYYLTLLTVVLVVAMDSFYIIVIHHSCVLFTIVGFKLRTAHIVDKTILYKDNEWQKLEIIKLTAEEQEKTFRNVIQCVSEHNRALQYVDLIQSMFSTTLLIQIGLNIVSLSISAVEMLLYMNQIEIALGMGCWLAAQEFHLLFLCLPGQRLSNSSENVYYNSLECMWYLFSSKTIVVYQFFLQNTIQTRELIAMKLTVLNMETFQAVTRLAASYFTVLSSTL